ncbi:MAG TPA: hypothetical protein VGG41_12970 [Solirubrobacteraceae bacterium]
MAVVVAALGMIGSGVAFAGPRAAGCKPSPRAYTTAAPAAALLDVVGVLRDPATTADRTFAREFKAAAAANPGRFSGRITFVNYFRLARVVGGIYYYLVPVIRVSCDGAQSADGISVMGRGGSYCCDYAPAIARGQASVSSGSGSSRGPTTIVTLIPDGVASITIDLSAGTTPHYPRLPDGKLQQEYNKAYTTTTPIVGNLLVVIVPGAPGRINNPLTVQWRSTTGHVLRTLSHL